MPEDDTDIYSDETRENLAENDEITPGEEGFMEGAGELGQGAKCRNCGKPIGDKCVEKEIDGENCRFCCDECVEEYEKKKEKGE